LDESSGSLFINKEKALLLTDSRYTIQAKREVKNFEVITHKEGLINALPDIFNQLNTRRLGFEGGYLIWDLYQKAKNQASLQSPVVELVAVSGLVEDLRKIKCQEEIDSLSSSAQLMGNILAQVIQELKPGQTERNIAWKIESLIHERNGDGVSFPPIVASGENAALPHATPTNKKIMEHEPIILDVGSIVDGYCSDMTRTVFEFFGHSLGHGIGLVPHEMPYVGPRNPAVLQEGMVFTVEPGIYIPGKGGIRLEEMVILEKDGARVLTTNNNFL
jgi:Xaa-Pro aminopeptidase